MVLLDSNKNILNIFKNQKCNRFNKLELYVNNFIVCGFGGDEYTWYYKIYDNNYNLLYENISDCYFLNKSKGLVLFIDRKLNGLNSFIYNINKVLII